MIKLMNKAKKVIFVLSEKSLVWNEFIKTTERAKHHETIERTPETETNTLKRLVEGRTSLDPPASITKSRIKIVQGTAVRTLNDEED